MKTGVYSDLEYNTADIYNSFDKHFLNCVLHVTLFSLYYWTIVWLDSLDFLLNEKWHFITKTPAVNTHYHAASGAVGAAVEAATFASVFVHYEDSNDDDDDDD